MINLKVTYLKPRENGRIDLDDLNNAMRKDTVLVSIMGVNNEIGVLQVHSILYETNDLPYPLPQYDYTRFRISTVSASFAKIKRFFFILMQHK